MDELISPDGKLPSSGMFPVEVVKCYLHLRIFECLDGTNLLSLLEASSMVNYDGSQMLRKDLRAEIIRIIDSMVEEMTGLKIHRTFDGHSSQLLTPRLGNTAEQQRPWTFDQIVHFQNVQTKFRSNLEQVSDFLDQQTQVQSELQHGQLQGPIQLPGEQSQIPFNAKIKPNQVSPQEQREEAKPSQAQSKGAKQSQRAQPSQQAQMSSKMQSKNTTTQSRSEFWFDQISTNEHLAHTRAHSQGKQREIQEVHPLGTIGQGRPSLSFQQPLFQLATRVDGQLYLQPVASPPGWPIPCLPRSQPSLPLIRPMYPSGPISMYPQPAMTHLGLSQAESRNPFFAPVPVLPTGMRPAALQRLAPYALRTGVFNNFEGPAESPFRTQSISTPNQFHPQRPKTLGSGLSPLTVNTSNSEWQNRFGGHSPVIPNGQLLPYRAGSNTMYHYTGESTSNELKDLIKNGRPSVTKATDRAVAPFAENAKASKPAEWGVMKIGNVSGREHI